MQSSTQVAILTNKTTHSPATRNSKACRTLKVTTTETRAANVKRPKAPKATSSSSITSTISKSRSQRWRPKSSFWKIEKSTKKTRHLAMKLFSATVFPWMNISWLWKTNSTTKRTHLKSSSGQPRKKWSALKKKMRLKRTELRFWGASMTQLPRNLTSIVKARLKTSKSKVLVLLTDYC